MEVHQHIFTPLKHSVAPSNLKNNSQLHRCISAFKALSFILNDPDPTPLTDNCESNLTGIHILYNLISLHCTWDPLLLSQIYFSAVGCSRDASIFNISLSIIKLYFVSHCALLKNHCILKFASKVKNNGIKTEGPFLNFNYLLSGWTSIQIHVTTYIIK